MQVGGASDTLHCLLQGRGTWRHPMRTIRRALSRQDSTQVGGPSTLCSPLGWKESGHRADMKQCSEPVAEVCVVWGPAAQLQMEQAVCSI